MNVNQRACMLKTPDLFYILPEQQENQMGSCIRKPVIFSMLTRLSIGFLILKIMIYTGVLPTLDGLLDIAT